VDAAHAPQLVAWLHQSRAGLADQPLEKISAGEITFP
jgi:hypothetical protein